MAVSELFKEAWNKKFPGEPLPTNLAFLEDKENLQSLGAAADSAQRTIDKLNKERSKQQMILDFVVERIDTVLATSRVRSSSSCLDENEEQTESHGHAPLSDRTSYSEAASPVGKVSSRTSYGQPVRAQGAAAQFAAVMASAKSKLGFGWSHSSRNSGVEGSSSGHANRDSQSAMHYFGKKPNIASKFYDSEKSNMVRTCSAPSLIDDSAEYKPRPQKGRASNRYGNISAALNLTAPAIQSVTNLSSAGGNNSFAEQVNGGSGQTAECILETDIDEVAPPLPPPPIHRACKQQSEDKITTLPSIGKVIETDVVEVSDIPPAVDRSGRMQTAEDMMRLRASKVRPVRHHIYEEPMDDHIQKGVANSTDDEADTEDVHASSDEEPLYLNLLLRKQQKDQQLFLNDATQRPLALEPSDGIKNAIESSDEVTLANALSLGTMQ